MQNTFIKIVDGSYRLKGKSTSVAGTMFPLVNAFATDKQGGFVTVDSTKVEGFPDRNIKIRCESPKAYEFVNESEFEKSVSSSNLNAPGETEEKAIERIRERFDILDTMTEATMEGTVRAMIVSGPPGVGKSYGVETVLDRYGTVSTLGNTAPKYEVCKGAMSPIGLYCKLYKLAAKDNVIVFDDCDSILLDDLSLNILKAALDSKKTRRICWNTDSHMLRREGVPDTFEFAGSVIFITNIKFDNVRSKKLRDHLEALESRCHYIDLTIDTLREKLLRIQQIVKDGMLNSYALPQDTQAEVVQYIWDNKRRLREISLRTVLKIADLAKAFPDTWRDMASSTVLKPV